MKNACLLKILAAALLLVMSAVTVVIVMIRVPEPSRFSESLISAHYAGERGSQGLLRRELLRASRYAVSSADWNELLSAGLLSQPGPFRPADYKLFTALAGRAAAAVPGYQDFTAYWIWGLLRSGRLSAAVKNLPALQGPRWSSLRAEVRLAEMTDGSPEGFEAYIGEAEKFPEFLEQAAALTESAELTFDAALLYALNGNPQKSRELADRVMHGNLRWSRPESFVRYRVPQAAAYMALDTGYTDDAIRWMTTGITEGRNRRAESWEDLQLLGDLHWERFTVSRSEADRNFASEYWYAAMQIVRQSGDNFPESSWRIWNNLALLHRSQGRISTPLTDEALRLFPDQKEVQAAWIREHSETDSALVRRFLRTAGSDGLAMGTARLKFDPDFLSPELYETRLWELFNTMEGEHVTNRRDFMVYLLDYLSFRNHYASVDVAVDRYLSAYPDEHWVLSRRLAADAARGWGRINLLSDNGIQPLQAFRDFARMTKSSKGLYNSALFMTMTAAEIAAPGAESVPDQDMLLASVLFECETFPADGIPIADRISRISRISRLSGQEHGLEKQVKGLSASGRRGEEYRRRAESARNAAAGRLYRQALEDLSMAIQSAPSEEELDKLRALQSYITERTGVPEL